MKQTRIARLLAREILDSRGNPTIEVECLLNGGAIGRASVPSGVSTGSHEALELRDGDPARYLGKGVTHAVRNVIMEIQPRLIGVDVADQFQLDRVLIELDGTENKSRFGANAILGVSLAAYRAVSEYAGISVYRLIAGTGACRIPVPLLNIINGGAHASNNLDVQEYMIVPAGFTTFADALRVGAEIYQTLKLLLKEAGKPTTIGDEGGFAPDFKDNEEPLELIVRAIEKAGYRPGEQVFLALDVAAGELASDGQYVLQTPSERRLSAREMTEMYLRWLNKYPIVSIEDGLGEEDWDGWREHTALLGDRVQLVGDDIFVTNVKRLKRAFDENVANAVLVKLNQIGTVSETLECVGLAKENGYRTIISHRSGETGDDFIADLAVATNAGQIKAGAPCRGERVAKYNRLLRIEERDGLEYSGLEAIER